MKKEESKVLIREYIDVFAWNCKDMPGLDPQVAMHHLNIKPDAKPVKQQQRRFRPDITKLLKPKSINSSHVVSYGRNNIQIGLLTLSPFLRRMKKFRSVLITAISIQPTLKTNSHYPLPMSWLTIPADSREYLLWTAFQDIIKSRRTKGMRSILQSGHR